MKKVLYTVFSIFALAFTFVMPVSAQSSDDGSILGLQDDIVNSGLGQSALSTDTSNSSPLVLLAILIGILLLAALLFLLAKRRKKERKQEAYS